MEEINRLHDIADDIGSTSWGYELASALHNIAADIGEKVDEMLRVLGADGVEVHKGDEVWSTTGEFDGKRTVSSVHIDPDEPPYAMFEERQKPYSCLCCYLTHQRPVFDADGVPIHEGDTVWGVEDGKEFEVVNVNGELPLLKYGETAYTATEPEHLTHQRPVLDADGVPIHEGDTVYLLPGEWCGEYPLRYYSAGDEMVVKELCPDHEVEGVLKCAVDGKCNCFPLPCQLTHTKPEPSDTDAYHLGFDAGSASRQHEVDEAEKKRSDYYWDKDKAEKRVVELEAENEKLRKKIAKLKKRCKALAGAE